MKDLIAYEAPPLEGEIMTAKEADRRIAAKKRRSKEYNKDYNRETATWWAEMADNLYYKTFVHGDFRWKPRP